MERKDTIDIGLNKREEAPAGRIHGERLHYFLYYLPTDQGIGYRLREWETDYLHRSSYSVAGDRILRGRHSL